jgi:DNA-binding beta-propeller fold protein YncE
MMFWSDTSGNAIYRSALDGSDSQMLLSASDGVSSPRSIAIDHVAEQIYWTQGTSILRSNLDGSGVQTVLSSGLYNSWGLSVDETNRKLYFTDSRYSDGDRIARCDLDGTNYELMVINQRNPIGIDVDPAGGKMYWAVSDRDGYMGIRSANLDGTGVRDVYSSSATWPLDVDYYAGTGLLYVSDQHTDSIDSMTTAGGNAGALLSGLDRSFGLDVYEDRVYYADYGQGTISRASVSGGSGEVLVGGLNDPNGLAIYNAPPPISAELVRNEDCAIPGCVTFDVVVSPSHLGDWTNARLEVSLDRGSLWEHPTLDARVPQADQWASEPDLEWDSFVSAPDFQEPLIAPLPGDHWSDSTIAVDFYDADTSADDPFVAARLTVGQDAVGIVEVLLFDSYSSGSGSTLLAYIPEKGDMDADGDVDATDLAGLGMNWAPAGSGMDWAEGDFDYDGDVDATDLALLGMNWAPSGYGPAIPEPTALVLLALGGAAILRRKRNNR